jgi:hypothetical protein
MRAKASTPEIDAMFGDRSSPGRAASRNRHHNDLLVSSTADVDAELKRWLAAAYSLVT